MCNDTIIPYTTLLSNEDVGKIIELFRDRRPNHGQILAKSLLFMPTVSTKAIIFYNELWCFTHFGTIAQFKIREKHPGRSVAFSKVTG